MPGGLVCRVDKVDADLDAIFWSCSLGYASGRLPGVSTAQKMHRLVLERKLGKKLEAADQVDHVNGDRLDNRRSNLRVATPGQNAMNHRLRSDNKSGYKGVWFDAKLGKYTAFIRSGGRRKHIGVYVNAEGAALAYNEAAIRHHGEFAHLNIISPEDRLLPTK
jgi:hypothetical protein